MQTYASEQIGGSQCGKHQHQPQQQQQHQQHFQRDLQQQQLSPVKNHTENVNFSNLSGSASLNLHCLVCNSRLWVLSNGANNGIYDLFAEKTRTSHRRLRPVSILEGIVKEQLIYAPLHSNIICKRCFNLIDEIDEIEVTLVGKREEVSSLYYRTKAEINKEPLEKPKEKDSDTGAPDNSGKVHAMLGQVMLDVRSGKLVMQSEETKEKVQPKKVSLTSNNNGSYNDDDVDDNYESLFGPPDDDTDSDSMQEDFTKVKRIKDKKVSSQPHQKASSKNPKKKTNSSDKTFNCPVCGKSFKDRTELQEHRHTHGERPYQCDICGRSFSQKGNQLRHKRITHLQERRFKCDICDKAFKWKRILIGHVMAVHTGERPYKCDHCEAAFRYKQHRKKHMRIHTGEKPYVCNICGKSFSCSNNCNAHMFTHTDKKQYECLLCSAGFMRKTQILSHIKQHGYNQDQEQYFKVNTPGDVIQGMVLPGAVKTTYRTVPGNAATSPAHMLTTVKSMKGSGSGSEKHQMKHHSRTSTQLLTTVSEVDHRAAQISARALPHSASTTTMVLPSSSHAITVTMPTTTLPTEQNTSHTHNNMNNIGVYDMPVIFIDSETAASQQGLGAGEEQVLTQHFTTVQHSRDHW